LSSSSRSSSSQGNSSSSSGSNSVSIGDDKFHKIEGNVTITCSTQKSVRCYADPREAINIGCKTLDSWAEENNPSYIGECGGNGTGGSISCVVPAGKNVYCK
jgi:hypothetical protein